MLIRLVLLRSEVHAPDELLCVDIPPADTCCRDRSGDEPGRNYRPQLCSQQLGEESEGGYQRAMGHAKRGRKGNQGGGKENIQNGDHEIRENSKREKTEGRTRVLREA